MHSMGLLFLLRGIKQLIKKSKAKRPLKNGFL